MKEWAITTVDNPYDPIEECDKWRAFDEGHGYYTLSKLDTFAKTSYAMADGEELRNINDAINDLIRLGPPGLYKKIPLN